MSQEASGEWRALCADFTALARHLDHVSTVNVNSNSMRSEVAALAERYLISTRPFLNGSELAKDRDELDSAFSTLLQLTHGRNALSSYKKQVKRIKRLIPGLTTKIAISASDEEGNRLSVEEEKLIQTVENLVPSAALSYQQAIRDLNDKDRLSFRGPALELREALRETLDQLAPDTDVMASPSWKPEGDRKTPTTKQKVRFILSARGVGKSGREVPEDTADTVDELIAGLTRSVQNMSSLATHVATEKTNVRRVKRYIDALLLDILELN
jgi:hypothetical protein